MKPLTRVCWLAILLRVVAISAIFSGISFFFPVAWIDSFLAWCGLEPLPDANLMRYVLRGAGYLQVGIGVVIWVIARDVVRFQPVVIAVLTAFLVGAPAFYWIDAAAGLPRWFCFVDFTCCFLAGAVPLAFCLCPSSNDRVA